MDGCLERLLKTEGRAAGQTVEGMGQNQVFEELGKLEVVLKVF